MFIDRLAKKMPANVTVVADVGQNQIWTCTEYKVPQEGRLLTSGGMGTMGYSVPAAIGAKWLTTAEQPLLYAVTGAFQMSFMELATAVQFGVDIKGGSNDQQPPWHGKENFRQMAIMTDRQQFLDGSPGLYQACGGAWHTLQ